MITDPAKFTLDAIDHMRTIKDVDEFHSYFNGLIKSIVELDSKTACRVMYNFIMTTELNSQDIPDFKSFLKKHGRYVIESCNLDHEPEFRKLYTRDEANAK